MIERIRVVFFVTFLACGIALVVFGLGSLLAQQRTQAPPLLFRKAADGKTPLCVEMKEFAGSPEGRSKEFVRCVTLDELRPIMMEKGRSLDELRNVKVASR